jgi:predicted outer membrane repeat protein
MRQVLGSSFVGVRGFSMGAAFAFFAVVAAERPAAAATINVGTGCTLLQAISAANGDKVVGSCTKGSGHDDIVLAAGTVTLSSAIEIWSDVTIRGAGMGKTIITSSNLNAPSFNAGMGACAQDYGAAVYVSAIGSQSDMSAGIFLPVTFQDLTLQPASGAFNQGICVGAGKLVLNGARVTGFQNVGVWIRSDGSGSSLLSDGALIDNNHSQLNGGGIFFFQDSSTVGSTNSGNLTMKNTTVSNNTAEGNGGGLYIGEGEDVSVNAIHIITTSTFSNNLAYLNGAGIYDDIQHSGTYLEIFQTTIASNTAYNYGGGIYKTTVGSADIEIFQDVVHSNTSSADSATNNLNYNSAQTGIGWRLHCADSLIQLTGTGWNADTLPFIDSGTCDFTTTNAKLGALVGKGGTNNLPVRPLLSGSPAIDLGGDGPASPTDERGYSVLVDGDGNGTKKMDRGSYEYIPLQLETESLTVAAKTSNVTHTVLSGSANAAFSNSGGTNLGSNDLQQYVTYQTPSISSGTYAVRIRFKKGTSAAKFQVAWSNSANGTFTNVGSAVDGYASSTTMAELDLGNVTLTGSSARFFRFIVTGKNSSSGGYQMYPDFVMLRK